MPLFIVKKTFLTEFVSSGDLYFKKPHNSKTSMLQLFSFWLRQIR